MGKGEVACYLVEYRSAGRNVGRTEICPCGGDIAECYCPRYAAHRQSVGYEVKESLERLVYYESQSVDNAPEHEHEGGSVPQSCHSHRQQTVEVGAQTVVAVASERNVQVVAEPCGERDVPSAPELREVGRLVRKTEVVLQTYSQQCRQSDAYVAVAGEVAIDLHGVAQHSHEVLKPRISFRRFEYPVVVLRYVVGYDSLFHQSNYYKPQSGVNHSFGHVALETAQLRKEVARTCYRSCQQEREERDVEQIF